MRLWSCSAYPLFLTRKETNQKGGILTGSETTGSETRAERRDCYISLSLRKT